MPLLLQVVSSARDQPEEKKEKWGILCVREMGRGEYWKDIKLEGDFRLRLEFLGSFMEKKIKPFPLIAVKSIVNL